MPSKKSDKFDDDRRVMIDREEHNALVAMRDSLESRLVEDEKTKVRLHDLTITCGAQAKRLTEVELITQHLERTVGLQRVLIDMLKADVPTLASLEDLSLFWRSWIATTESLAIRDPKQRDEISKLEPDLFRSWKLWVRDAGRASRSLALVGTVTRADVDDRLDVDQATLQEQIIEQQRQSSALQAARVVELEAEIKALRDERRGLGPKGKM